MTTGIGDAVKLVGNQIQLSMLLGCTRQAVSKWVKRGWVSPARAVEIEATLGIPRARLIHPRLRSNLSVTGLDEGR